VTFNGDIMKRKSIKQIVTEARDEFSYAGASEIPNREFVSDALTEIDNQLKVIAQVVHSTKDPELKTKMKEAFSHIQIGFQMLENLGL
jgi:hypothetical protein